MKNTKTNAKFNVIDIIIISIVIICLLFAVNVLRNRFSRKPSQALDVTLKITGVSNDSLQLLEKGQNVFIPEFSSSFGSIKQINAESHKEYIYNNESARFTNTEFPDFYDLYLTLSVNCVKKNGRYYKDTFEISSNIIIKPDIPFKYDNAVIYNVTESEGGASGNEK
ncbi:MAG: DUF4330 family protein [Clostridiales bacterium]|nr:DUF4330 family protein [Clostridiales bacterium]